MQRLMVGDIYETSRIDAHVVRLLVSELPLLQGSWDRAVDRFSKKRKQAEGRSLNGEESNAAAHLRKLNRQKWEANFRTAFGMDGSSADRRPSFERRMAGIMENLPQACLQETRAWYGFELLGWALIAFQGSVAYCIMVNLAQTPIKLS